MLFLRLLLCPTETGFAHVFQDTLEDRGPLLLELWYDDFLRLPLPFLSLMPPG